MTASLFLVACGHSNTNEVTTGLPDTTVTVMPTDKMADCWSQEAEVWSGLNVEIYDDGKVRLHWTDWDKFMGVVSKSLGASYPYDAPLQTEDILGLRGKVKALAVLGPPMSPMAYFLLQNNSVQVFSFYKLVSTWNFYAGRIVAYNVVNVRNEVKDYSVTVIESKDGSTVRDDDFVVNGCNLYGYSIDDRGTQVEHLQIDIDGAMTYSFSDALDGPSNKVYHGYITEWERDDDTLENEYEYILVTQETSASSSIEKIGIKGEFELIADPKLKGHWLVKAKKGINMASFDNFKLGQVRTMLDRDVIEKYLR